LRENGCGSLPQVAFTPAGKPCFPGEKLYFSLAHSGNTAAAVLSDAPCGVDIELVRKNVDPRLVKRCLSENELAAGCDFFDIWTKKECIAKLEGSGLPGRPNCMDTLASQYENHFFTQRIFDSSGNEYALTALGTGFYRAEKRSIISE
jgi:phosphopantetheinyl transferase